MQTLRRLTAAVLVIASSPSWGTPFENDLLRLEVPTGFNGPIYGRMDERATAVAFSKPHADAPTSTLLQVTIFNTGAIEAAPKEQLGSLADKYLPQFLGGIERRRTNYSATGPSRVTLGGIPASRARWSGSAEGRQLHGVMYCVIVGTKVLSLHVQDVDTAPASNFKEAEAAVKAVRFKTSGRAER